MASQKHLVADKSFLECRAHERVTGPTLCENSKMNPEERKVNNGRHQDETDNPGHKMPPKVVLVDTVTNDCHRGERNPTIECPFWISRISHRSTSTAVPIVRNVNNPTILDPRVAANEAPVAIIQNHQSNENSLDNRTVEPIWKLKLWY